MPLLQLEPCCHCIAFACNVLDASDTQMIAVGTARTVSRSVELLNRFRISRGVNSASVTVLLI